jgi:hypothetical protein
MQPWAMRGGRWFWLYAALVAVVWVVVVTLLDVPWFAGLLFALCQVEVGFRVVEWVRRRRLSSRASP